jgi:hypothetical protein
MSLGCGERRRIREEARKRGEELMTIFDKLIADWSAKAQQHRTAVSECLEEPEEAYLHGLEARLLEDCIADLQAVLTPPSPPQPDISF